MGNLCTSSVNANNYEKKRRKNIRHYFTNEQTCHEQSLLILGYIRATNSQLKLPLEITKLCKEFFGSVDGDLIIENSETVQLIDYNHRRYEYESIILKKNATLTVNRFNPKTGLGGVLHIVCNGNVILEENAKIRLTGAGYHGGRFGRNGESYHRDGYSVKSKKFNFGGGGGSGKMSLSSEFGAKTSRGAGGGYGTCGCDGIFIDENDKNCAGNKDETYGIGGQSYGDMNMEVLHLGSGGGSGYYFDEMMKTLCARTGGSGGGALKLQCFGKFIMKERSKICCNGAKGENGIAGAGSGGSIHITVLDKNNLQMNATSMIEAVGGRNMNASGNGGDGRIIIECCNKGKNECCVFPNVNPKPYVY